MCGRGGTKAGEDLVRNTVSDVSEPGRNSALSKKACQDAPNYIHIQVPGQTRTSTNVNPIGLPSPLLSLLIIASHCSTVRVILTVACEFPELAVTLTKETPGGVAAPLFVSRVLPAPLPQPRHAATNKSAVAIPRKDLARRDRRSMPAKTIPITLKPYQIPPMPSRGFWMLATLSVVIWTVTLPGRAEGLSDEGLNRQVVLAGNPAQPKVMGDSSVPLELILRLKLPPPPAGTD